MQYGNNTGAQRPALGGRSTSASSIPEEHPTTRSESTSKRPDARRFASDTAVRTLANFDVQDTSRLRNVLPGTFRANNALVNPNAAAAATTKTPSQPPPMELAAPKPQLPRGESAPLRGRTARQRVPIPKPDAGSWYGELLERTFLSLRPVKQEQIRTLGKATVADVGDRTLVLSTKREWSGATEQHLVTNLLSTGLNVKVAVVVRHEGRLCRINANGSMTPLRDGLYTFGIDQSNRLLTPINGKPGGSAACSADGRDKDGAPGAHGELAGYLGGFFFGEAEASSQAFVAYNNRTSTYLTPEELAHQAQSHELLAGAKFYPFRTGAN